MHAWDLFLEAQDKELGKDTVNKWLRTLRVIKFDACNLFLEAKDAFQAMWFEEHIRPKVLSRLINNNNKKINVHLVVASASGTQEPAPPKIRARHQAAQKIAVQPFTLSFDELDPHCTFSNYIALEPNEVVTKLLHHTVGLTPESPNPELAAFNPLFIYGRQGTGKTHLLMATAHALKARGINAIYSRAETFTEHVISAIRAGEMSAFRQAYRNSDVLIIDDVHVFSKKGATQEEFFHTFNTLHVSGKQIILSANCHPSELQMIEPRLVSRFEWGIVLGLAQPLQGEAAEIIEAKAAALRFPLHPKVKDFLLNTFTSSPKSLTKALEALILRTHLKESQGKAATGPLTVSMAKHYLNDLILEENHLALTPQKIIQSAAEYFGIKPDDVQGKSQTRDCVLSRQLSMHLCRLKLEMPYTKIGQIFNKDHSTVMSSVKLIDKGIEDNDPEITAPHAMILNKLQM